MTDLTSSFWQKFINKFPEFKNEQIPKADYFCDNEKDANETAALTLRGVKRGTCGALSSYEYFKDELPKIGDLWIVTDFKGKPVCVTRTIKISIIKYKDITEEWAKIEGEGDLSLAYWRKTHWAFFERDLASYNAKPSLDMKLVCEQFEILCC